MRVTLKDVVSRQPVEVMHLDKTQPPVRARLDEVQLEDGRQVIRFPGRGMPASTQSKKAKGSRPGDAVIVVEIALPKKLSDAQRQAICAALDGSV
jgi:DnaJ-class molecular chaperone